MKDRTRTTTSLALTIVASLTLSCTALINLDPARKATRAPAQPPHRVAPRPLKRPRFTPELTDFQTHGLRYCQNHGLTGS